MPCTFVGGPLEGKILPDGIIPWPRFVPRDPRDLRDAIRPPRNWPEYAVTSQWHYQLSSSHGTERQYTWVQPVLTFYNLVYHTAKREWETCNEGSFEELPTPQVAMQIASTRRQLITAFELIGDTGVDVMADMFRDIAGKITAIPSYALWLQHPETTDPR